MGQSITQLDSTNPNFDSLLDGLLDRNSDADHEVDSTVRQIIEQVRGEGDQALVELTNKFDSRDLSHVTELEVDKTEIKAARGKLDASLLRAMEDSAKRIQSYHEHQFSEPWNFADALGNRLGQLVTPIERVGIYVPGGKASYPSSVLMTAIPARVAGVEHTTLVVPAPGGDLNPSVLAAAEICAVDLVLTIGGAQAIAALAYGTETIGKVDKIVGPGNIYVATAKKQVFGDVGIDMIAGPSEVVIVADESANPEWLVLDLFAQAEHDERAQAILISDNQQLLDQVCRLIDVRLEAMPRKEIIRTALSHQGAVIKVRDLQEGLVISNHIAPEHLELACAGAEELLGQVRHAGAVFLGHHSAESMGDYSAGPSHVLPTAGTARFSSPLGVYDFQKRSSVIACSRQGSLELGQLASRMARDEGLVAHALSAECRISNE